VPSTDAWARKLGAAAQIETEDPGSAAPPVTLIDNGHSGYSEIDQGEIDWTTLSRPNALNGTLRLQNGGGVGDTAIWEFTALQPGWYQVMVSFQHAGDKATNAPYAVYDGALLKGTVTLDQTVAPSGAVFEGVPWESLDTFSIAGDTLRVELSDYADGNIVADAVRLVPVRNEVQLLSLEKSLTSEDVTAQVSVTVETP